MNWKTWGSKTEADALRPTYAAYGCMDIMLRAQGLTHGNCIDAALDAVRAAHLSPQRLQSLIGDDFPEWIYTALDTAEFKYGLDDSKNQFLNGRLPDYTKDFKIDPLYPTESLIKEMISLNMVSLLDNYDTETYRQNISKQWCDIVLGRKEDDYSLEPLSPVDDAQLEDRRNPDLSKISPVINEEDQVMGTYPKYIQYKEEPDIH